MDFAKVTQLVLSASVMMIVFSLGLQATMQDATYLFRQPKRLLLSMIAMLIIMPVFAAVLVQALALPPAVKITMLVLAVSPVPPILPKREPAAGGTRSYALGLLVAAAVISMVFVPAAVELFGKVFNKPVGVSTGTIARIVTASVIGPLAAGLAVRRFWAGFAQQAAAPLSRLATLLLIAAVLPVLLTHMSGGISLIGHGTLFALAAFVVVGLVVGTLLGGPELSHRIVLCAVHRCSPSRGGDGNRQRKLSRPEARASLNSFVFDRERDYFRTVSGLAPPQGEASRRSPTA